MCETVLVTIPHQSQGVTCTPNIQTVAFIMHCAHAVSAPVMHVIRRSQPDQHLMGVQMHQSLFHFLAVEVSPVASRAWRVLGFNIDIRSSCRNQSTVHLSTITMSGGFKISKCLAVKATEIIWHSAVYSVHSVFLIKVN